MYHSVTFGDKNTWTDWHLIPSSRPSFNQPPVKTRFLEIPGAHGQLNMVTIATGRPVYGVRTGSLDFIVAPGYLSWEITYSNIMNYLHGKTLDASLEDDPVYYYEGQFTVNSWKSGKSFSGITIDYTVNPYKKSISSLTGEWLWDPFNFETDTVPEVADYMDVQINGSKTIVIPGSPEPQALRVTTTAIGMSVKFNNITTALPLGKSNVPSVMLVDGDNTLIFYGTGKITIDYRGGSL